MSQRDAAARVLWRFHGSAFCMDGGFFLVLAAVPYKILALGGGSSALGLAPAIGSLVYIVFTQVSGRGSDRWGRSRLCFAGSAILALFSVVAYRVDSLAALMWLMPLMGIGKALYWPVTQSTVGDLSRPGELARNIGRFNVGWSLGKTAGFLGAGLLLAAYDFRATFLTGTAAVVTAFLLLPKGHLPRVRPDAGAAGSTGPPVLPPPASAAVRRRFRRMGWVANTAAYAAAGILAAHLPRLFTEWGWSEQRFGSFLALLFLTQTVTFTLLAGRVRFAYSAWRLLAPQVAATAALAVLPWLPAFGAVLALAPVLGVSSGVSYSASIYYSLDTVEGKGRNAGTHESLVGVGGFLPPLVGGILADRLGLLTAPYLLGAALLALALAWQWLLWRPARIAAGDPGRVEDEA
jgi:MFS family permease